MNLIKEIFSGNNNRLSSKRIIGTMLLTTGMLLWIDSHYSIRELNNESFNAVLYVGGGMIAAGVAEGLMNKFKKPVE